MVHARRNPHTAGQNCHSLCVPIARCLLLRLLLSSPHRHSTTASGLHTPNLCKSFQSRVLTRSLSTCSRWRAQEWMLSLLYLAQTPHSAVSCSPSRPVRPEASRTIRSGGQSCRGSSRCCNCRRRSTTTPALRPPTGGRSGQGQMRWNSHCTGSQRRSAFYDP